MKRRGFFGAIAGLLGLAFGVKSKACIGADIPFDRMAGNVDTREWRLLKGLTPAGGYIIFDEPQDNDCVSFRCSIKN